MSRRDPGAATGTVAAEPSYCKCGHLEPLHTLTEQGNRTGCTASTCDCKRYEEAS